jgi:hypothetical protein
MKIIICGSINAAEEILRIKKELENKGWEVEIPEGVKRPEIRVKTEAPTAERADIKIKYDLIRGYFKKMKNYDAVLVVNPEKKGIKGYIGGNTLIEMAFAHILNKKLYCLYPVPELSYTSEILAMQPVILYGNLNKLASQGEALEAK